MKTIFTFILTFILTIELILPANLFALALSPEVRGLTPNSTEGPPESENRINFPDHILLKFLILPPTDIASMAKTSRQLYALAHNPLIWQHIANVKFPQLRTQLASNNQETRRIAKETLLKQIEQNQHTIPALISVLIPLLEHQDPDVVQDTLELLQTIVEHEQAIPAFLPHVGKLISMLTHEDCEVSRKAKQLLDPLNQHEQTIPEFFPNVSKLISMLTHKDCEVSRKAKQLLETIANQFGIIQLNLSPYGKEHPQIGAWEYLETIRFAQHPEWILFEQPMPNSEHLVQLLKSIFPLFNNQQALLQQLGELDTQIWSVFRTTTNLLDHLQQAIEQSA